MGESCYGRCVRNFLLTATFPHLSGLPEDEVSQSFAIRSQADVASGATALAALKPCFDQWLNTPNAGGHALGQYLSTGLSRVANAIQLKLYLLDGKELATVPAGAPAGTKPRPPSHGSPIATDLESMTASASAVGLPEEVAAVLTLRARDYELMAIEVPDDGDEDSVPQRPRQRFSGRVFLGPLADVTMTTTSGKSRLAGVFQTAVLDAADRFHDALDTAGYNWCVWSRMDGLFRPIDTVQIDDAFDTQRRRGVKPTARQTRTVA